MEYGRFLCVKLGNLYAMLEEQLLAPKKQPPLRISDWTLQKKGGVEMYGRSVLHLVLSGCFQSRKDMYSNSVIHITPNLGSFL